jgi:hypothetical protein
MTQPSVDQPVVGHSSQSLKLISRAVVFITFFLTACGGDSRATQPTAPPVVSTPLVSITPSPGSALLTANPDAALQVTLTALAPTNPPDATATGPSNDLGLIATLGSPAPTGADATLLTGTEEVTPIVVTIEPLLHTPIPPPLDISLPDGWKGGYDALLIHDVDGLRTIPIAVYTGPVTGGTGSIYLLWGFPNIVAYNPLQDGAQVDLWADGLRLLRLAVVEQGCNVGTDIKRQFSIGGLAASGTLFAAVDCPDLPDTRGWFAGLQEYGINFVFYAFATPISAVDSSAGELQAILDSVQFRIAEATPEAGATAEVTTSP